MPLKYNCKVVSEFVIFSQKWIKSDPPKKDQKSTTKMWALLALFLLQNLYILLPFSFITFCKEWITNYLVVLALLEMEKNLPSKKGIVKKKLVFFIKIAQIFELIMKFRFSLEIYNLLYFPYLVLFLTENWISIRLKIRWLFSSFDGTDNNQNIQMSLKLF